MMTEIQKYIVAEIAKVFLVVITATTLVMTLAVGINEGLKQGLPMSVAMSVLPYLVPETLRMTVPASLLFSICTVFGRMSANGEITAVKSMGVHPMRLFKPALWIAYAMSLTTFLMYDVCAIWARPGMKETLIRAVDEMAYSILRSEHVLSVDGVTLAVKEVRGRQLVEPRLKFIDDRGKPVMARASLATLEELDGSGVLRIRFCNLTVDQKNSVGILPGTLSYDIPFRDPVNKDPTRYSPAELKSTWLAGQIRHEQLKIASLQDEAETVPVDVAAASDAVQVQSAKQSYATSATSDTSDTSDTSPTTRTARGRELRNRTRRLNRLRAESPRRMSNGFAALAFAMVGIPIATWSKSQDNMTVFFMCIAPIAIIYYPLLVVGEEFARHGFWPQFSVWLAPLTLSVIGLLLIRKLVRH